MEISSICQSDIVYRGGAIMGTFFECVSSDDILKVISLKLRPDIKALPNLSGVDFFRDRVIAENRVFHFSIPSGNMSMSEIMSALEEYIGPEGKDFYVVKG